MLPEQIKSVVPMLAQPMLIIGIKLCRSAQNRQVLHLQPAGRADTGFSLPDACWRLFQKDISKIKLHGFGMELAWHYDSGTYSLSIEVESDAGKYRANKVLRLICSNTAGQAGGTHRKIASSGVVQFSISVIVWRKRAGERGF